MKFINDSSSISLLADGQLTHSYLQIPDTFEQLDFFFANHNIDRGDRLALECVNSVPSALVLLYFLEREYSFFLFPKTANISEEDRPEIPLFCRYGLRIDLAADAENEVLLHPDRWLKIWENDGWVGANPVSEVSNPTLYVRTSGSTGNPKLVAHSHAKLRDNVLNCVQRLHLKNGDRIAIPVPIFHMYGLGAAFLPGVMVGASIDLQKGANLLRYLQREREFNPNVAFMTPIFCETLLRGRRSPRPYRLTVAAGDRVREDTFKQYNDRFGCLVKLYGSTEMGAIAAGSPDDTLEVRDRTVGQPMPGVQMRLEKQSLEEGEGMEDTGELWCLHNCGFDSYVDLKGNSLPSETGDWFRTKDFGRIGKYGLEVIGRCDHSVNRNGLLVFFAEVEKAMESIAEIEKVIVVSKGESQRGKKLFAYCIPTKETKVEVTASEIRSHCFDLLPRHAIPDEIIIEKMLPLLPNGKVDRQKLTQRVG
ncbi:class I adenylate-forming enzyme family protein [Spirulina sp. 06S082]|uniref:class I adenylate-forming enzyme family protein n=1 Tax=Spirulina sp. 06S082 TaxID=3110248 RepID=UPI002B21F610|nr:class I adenylate-forming enzyme family protein [Spirulina sp. 06S082]MEA5469641.1 class I adenylate-forming enzyme family protein [Spirulina sp. 06S082]